MPFIRSYTETFITEVETTRHFFGGSDRPLLKRLFSLLFNRNCRIDQRINRIMQSATTKQWVEMNEKEKIDFIYKSMAEAKAIQRMLQLKN